MQAQGTWGHTWGTKNVSRKRREPGGTKDIPKTPWGGEGRTAGANQEEDRKSRRNPGQCQGGNHNGTTMAETVTAPPRKKT